MVLSTYEEPSGRLSRVAELVVRSENDQDLGGHGVLVSLISFWWLKMERLRVSIYYEE